MAVLYSCLTGTHNFFASRNHLYAHGSLVNSIKELIFDNLVYSNYTNLF